MNAMQPDSQNQRLPASFRADELLSPVGSGYSTAERLDPYWDRVWLSGSSVTWRSYDTAEAHVIAGLGGLPAAVRNMSLSEAWTLLESRRNQQALFRFLAVLTSWRTLTGEQMEALSGVRGSSKVYSKLVVAAFRVGILELGSPASGLMREASSARGTLYRPNAGDAVNRILEMLTYGEWVSMTGGQGWDQGSQYDRHNVLATELALRIAEYGDVATVLGEKLSTVDLLAGTGIGKDLGTRNTRSADLTIIRNDGLKIAVEVTASTSEHFQRKVERWAELLNRLPMSESGLAVVFLIVPPQGVSAASVGNATYRAVANVVRRFPGTATESIASRIGIAAWTDWFPARHRVSRAFLPLTVDLAAGMVNGSMTWHQVPLLSETAYPYKPSRKELVAILNNMHLLWGAPIWLRDYRRAPSMVPSMMEAAGVRHLPIPMIQKRRPSTSMLSSDVAVEPAARKLLIPRRLEPYM